MNRIINQQIKDRIISDLANLRVKHPEIAWDDPKGEIEVYMNRAIMLGWPDAMCKTSTYSTEKGISIQLDHANVVGLVEHFQSGRFGISMRSYTIQELMGV